MSNLINSSLASLNLSDEDQGGNEKLIHDSESLEDSQSNIQPRVQFSAEDFKPDVPEEPKPDGWCMMSVKLVYDTLSFLKPQFPLYYIAGKMKFLNRKIFGISFAALAILGYFSYGIISEVGKIILIQKYSQPWMSIEDLKKQFGG